MSAPIDPDPGWRPAPHQVIASRHPDRDAWRRAPAYGPDLGGLGMAVLDPADEAPRRLYFPQDPHLDAEGHRWVAERLLAFLCARDLLGSAGAAAGYSPAGSPEAEMR